MDVKGAFLNGDIDDEVLNIPLSTFDQSNHLQTMRPKPLRFYHEEPLL